MNDIKFFELFGEIDADIVQQANDDLNAWREAQEGVVVRAGSTRISPLRIVFASVACAAAVFGAVFLLRNVLKNGFVYEPANLSNSSVQGGESSNVESEYNTKITDEYIKTLNSVIDASTDVVALNGSIKDADGDNLVQKVQVFEHPDAFEQNVAYFAGELKDGAIVLVDFIDGTHYITSRGERTTEPVPMPMMFSHIIRRAGSVEQLKGEIDGYNRGLGDRALTKITLYQNGEDAANGSDNGVTLLENGKIVASDEDFKSGEVVRVEYGGGESWFEFSLIGAKIREDYDNSDGTSIPSGEPTFLIGPDGKAILTSEITSLENTDKTAETLTEDDFGTDIYCDGFAYYKEPCGIGYDNYKNPEMFGKKQFGTFYIGEEPENTNEWKRVYVGDEIFGLKVKSATAHFYINDIGDPSFIERHFYDNENGIELEGTVEAEGYFQILNSTERYPENGGLMFFYPATLDLPLCPSISGTWEVNEFKTRFGDNSVYNHIDEFLCAGEFEEIGLGYLDNTNCDMNGIGVGDIVYARVTLGNIRCYAYGAIGATLEKIEPLSDILAHDDNDI